MLRWLIRRLPRRQIDRKWEYTSAAAARDKAGFEAMEEYIQRRQNTVAEFIATQSLMGLCEETERTLGVRVQIRWWEKAGINLTGAR